MKKISVFLIMICLILTACNSNNSITTFQKTIDIIDEGKFLVNCSDEVNRGKKGNIDSIGYYCGITFINTTKFIDRKGNSLQFEDFSMGDSIRITLSKPQDISESNTQFDATEIVLLN